MARISLCVDHRRSRLIDGRTLAPQGDEHDPLISKYADELTIQLF